MPKPKRGKAVKKERNAEIIKKFKKGYKIEELEKIFSLSKKSIRSIIETGVNTNRPLFGAHFPARFQINWTSRDGRVHKRTLCGRY